MGLAAAAADSGEPDHPPHGRPGREVGDVRALPAQGRGGGAVHGARPGAGAATLQGAERMKEGKMVMERIYQKTEPTPEEQARIREIRERFQRERPSLEELVASGD